MPLTPLECLCQVWQALTPSVRDVLEQTQTNTVCTHTQCFVDENAAFGLLPRGSSVEMSALVLAMWMAAGWLFVLGQMSSTKK